MHKSEWQVGKKEEKENNQEVVMKRKTEKAKGK